MPAPLPTFGQATPATVSGTRSLDGKKLKKAKERRRGLLGIPWLGRRKPSAPDDPSPSASSGGNGERKTGIAAFFERASVLTVLGLFALVGLGSGVYLMFFRPEPITFAPRVHNIPLPTPTFQPFAPTEATGFLAVLPVSDLTYGLRSAQPTVMRPIAAWPTRFAEEWLLTYDDGASGTMTVQAVQHYSLETAETAYQSLLDAATAEIAAAQPGEASPSPSSSASASPSPTTVPGLETGIVSVNKVQVGESFKVIKDVTESVEDPDGGEPTEVTRTVAMVTWRNATAVFIMTADPAVIGDLFLEYGI